MKKNVLIKGSVLIAFCVATSVSACTKETETTQLPISHPTNPQTNQPIYTLESSMQADASLLGKDYNAINQYMHRFGWDYTENPNFSDIDDKNGIHCKVEYDNDIAQYVFQFFIHANNEVLDGDRGKLIDRQRNEMKSQTSSAWYKINGNWDERQKLSWKFRIPKKFRPSTNFCHIHQLKAQEGNNGAPLITITPRCDGDGSNRRMQVIHTGDVPSASKGTIIDNLPLSDFEGQWVQVETEMHYTHHGSFKIKMTRINDGKILVDKSFNDIDLWRKGAVSIRNKFGIYRSYGKTLTGFTDRPTNGIKDESLMLADFKVYEAQTNTNPTPHD